MNLFFFFFYHTCWLAEPWFPNQELNPDLGSESGVLTTGLKGILCNSFFLGGGWRRKAGF